MKRKVILALLATMILTVGSLGTVFATESNQRITIQTSETPGTGEETPDEPEAHTHTWGDAYYVKDADAVYDQVKVIDQEEKWDWVINIISPAWDEEITEVQDICFSCEDKGIHTQFVDGAVVGTGESLQDHVTAHMLNGEPGAYGSREVVVDTIHHEAVTEWVWTKVQDEISHMENVLVTPEKGHWEHACADCGEIQDRDTGEVIKPGTITPENPGTENPDTDKPINPDGNTDNPGGTTGDKEENTQKPGTSTGDNTQTTTGDNSQTTTDDKTQSGNENTSSTEDKSDGQGQSETKETTTADESEKADTTVTVSTEKKSPKTGDTSSLIYLATLAGSAVTGGTAFGLRRKFKK